MAWSQSIQAEGNLETDAQLVSNVDRGTAPLVVSSSTLVTSLNADLVDGVHGASLARQVDLQSLEAMLMDLQLQVDNLGLALIPRTGQTTCYDGLGYVVPCETGIGVGQDGDLQLGVTWPNPRFTINERLGSPDGTVTDNLTGLVWLRDADCFGDVTWPQALALVQGLFSGSTNDPSGGDCGLSDNSGPGEWRLPNIREMQSLIHYAFAFVAVPDTAGTGQWSQGDPFLDIQAAAGYWTSTQFAGAPGEAWVLSPNTGNDSGAVSDSSNLPFWPVRGGQ